MTIKSGQRYKITNEENGLVFDLARWGWYRHRYGRSIHAYGFHGKENQQVNHLRYFYIKLLVQLRYRPVDHREAGRRPMDYSNRRAPDVPRFPS